MRILDIITEASIFTRGTYSFGHTVRLAADNQEGKLLIGAINDIISDFNPGEKLEWVDVPSEDVPIVKFKKSPNVKYFKRENGEVFGVQGGDSSIQTALNHADKYNRGDIAEAILGASLTAKLIQRGRDTIGKVTVGDIQNVLKKSIKTSNNEVVFRVADKNSKIADEVNFFLRLPSGSMLAIKDPNNWKKFSDLFSSAEVYANDIDAEKYSNHFYKNGKVDEIRIVSDGVSDQKGRKTDVEAYVNTTDPVTGEVKKRTLKNVDISLKADSNIFHQHSSGGLTKGKANWLASAKALFEPLGITVDMPTRGVNDILTFWTAIYKQVATKLDAAFAGATANKEAKFIEALADQIESHATRGNKQLKLISFFKSDYSIHSFGLLKQRLIKNNINLGANLKIGNRSGKPSIEIYDKTSGELLTAVRFYLSSSASTNYWEKGPLLHDLTRIVKNKVDPALNKAPTNAEPEVAPEPAVATKAMPTPAYKVKPNKLTKKEPARGMTPSLDVPNMANNALDPESHLAVAESKK
jgi:hypothetical protein